MQQANTLMNPGLLTTLVGVMGALAGVAITAYFGYRTKKLDHALFVKRLRVERIFIAYENLLSVINEAQQMQRLKIREKEYAVFAFFSTRGAVPAWYRSFLHTWYRKRYLIDDDSYAICREINRFIDRLMDEEPSLEHGLPLISSEDQVRLTEALRPLLSKAHDLLRDYLLNRIQDA